MYQKVGPKSLWEKFKLEFSLKISQKNTFMHLTSYFTKQMKKQQLAPVKILEHFLPFKQLLKKIKLRM